VILLWGLCGDSPFDAVQAALQRRGAEHVVVDQRSVPERRVVLRYDDALRGRIGGAGVRVDLQGVTAAYWRSYDTQQVPEFSDHSGVALRTALAAEDAIDTWLEMTDALVVNRPTAMASNNSKPYQLMLLREHGFEVPATLVTTDPEAVLAFWSERAAVVYKSVSGARSIVSTLREAHLSRLENVAWCPTQFQQYVPGRDYRVHVIGERVFACEVVSDADDYRLAARTGQDAEVRAADVPDEVAQRCVAVTQNLGLAVSGVDLRRAPDGRWFAFEVNPSPAFTYYESQTGQPMADAIAALLASREA
jgi:glutathione synthase/RimK-type ligase-like ATP-grasp enzyme